MRHTENSNHEYILELENISKFFTGVKALDHVSLKLRKGEVLALIGENGAGKSTLINCVTGVFEPEEGSIRVNGQTVRLKNPQSAFENGISVVHQERNLISTFDVAENIFLDQICGASLSTIDRKKMHVKAKTLLERVKLDLDPYQSVEDLSSAHKQMIEIARALSIHSRILLLDEPTASISIQEAETLLEIIRELRDQGVSIIYVSHKLEEIFSIADRVKVIRDGKNIGDAIPIEQLTRDVLIEKMVGEREMKQAFPSHEHDAGDIVLEAKSIYSKHNAKANSFQLRRGEILGWYGLVGSGRTELAREIIGIDPMKGGEFFVNGKRVRIGSYKEAFEKYHISYLSENRKEEGLFLSHAISRNISIVTLNQVKNKLGMHSDKKERELADKYRELLKIKVGSIKHQISSLSGGNQQKVCISKCLVTQPEIIVIDEPTVGIDVHTKGEIHRLIYDLSRQGKSIILISSDLPELIQISERILVFREGKVVGEMDNPKDYDAASNQIMNMMLNP